MLPLWGAAPAHSLRQGMIAVVHGLLPQTFARRSARSLPANLRVQDARVRASGCRWTRPLAAPSGRAACC
eukprot:3930824-Alexandrium_andersonii.AAC.1